MSMYLFPASGFIDSLRSAKIVTIKAPFPSGPREIRFKTEGLRAEW
jgi:hypothetical protein